MFLKYWLHSTELVVWVLGRLHGAAFLFYVAVSLIAALRLRWPWWAWVLSLLAALPPLVTGAAGDVVPAYWLAGPATTCALIHCALGAHSILPARWPVTLAKRIKLPVFLAAGGKEEHADRTHQMGGAGTQGCRRAGGISVLPQEGPRVLHRAASTRGTHARAGVFE